MALSCLALLFVFAGAFWFAEPLGNGAVAGRPINDWLDDLSGKDDSLRTNAGDALRRHADDAVPLLVKVLDRKPNSVRRWIEVKLGTSVPHRLRTRHLDGDRRQAAMLLGTFGEAARPAVPALLRTADHAEWSVREASAVALIELGETAAAELAGQIARDPADPLNGRAAEVLERMHPHTASAVPVIVPVYPALPDPLQIQLAPVLARQAESFPTGAQALEDVVLDQAATLDVRAAALQALAAAPEAYDASRVVFDQALTNSQPVLRFHAAVGVWRSGGDANRVLDPLREGLADDRLRIEAVTLLGELGAAAGPAIPDLVAVLVAERSHRPLRTPPSAGIALSRIGTDAVPAVTALLQSTNAHARLNGVITIGLLGKRATSAGEHVQALLADREMEVRYSAALALNAIGRHTPRAIPVLREIMADDDPFMVTWAGDALAKIEAVQPVHQPADPAASR